MKRACRILATLVGALLLQGGCVDEQKQPDNVVSPPSEDANNTSKRMGTVAKNWQVKLLKLMHQDTATEAFLFVSESSYAAIGQFLVLKSGAAAELVRAKPASTEITRRSLAPSEWKSLAKVLETTGALSDAVTKQFDGTRYEFVHFTRPEGSAAWEESHRLVIALPNFDASTKGHHDLIQAFQALGK